MISFSIHFLLCNLLISIMIVIILLVKKMLRKHLSGCTQYRIWFLLPIILSLPFLSIRPTGLLQIMHWLHSMQAIILPKTVSTVPFTITKQLSSADFINDFGISVTRDSAPIAAYLPFVLWVVGMFAMVVFMIKSKIRLYHLEQSALPLQNPKVKKLYMNCIAEMQIKQNIPVYSTAFMTSPIMVGMFCPRIYIPIRLISDFRESDIRYMLLHELQHYKHKDAFVNCLMNIAAIVYWFNPVVWYALKEARTDREVACDTFVLQMPDIDYIDYGNTLLNFAQKISFSPFSFVSGIGGSAKQIRKRILNIALYRPQTKRHKRKERLIFAVLLILILESTALFPVFASNASASLPKDAVIQTDDLSDLFADYDGCFVLYDSNTDTWDIYNETLATKRFSPNSTYKIYSALFALENESIVPNDSILTWNGQSYPFSAWNRDQTLTSAMQNSVNWYFQTLDQKADFHALKKFYKTIDYGNHDLSGGVSEFWLESSLKISAVEQVELLKKLYTNEFQFDDHNVQAVKDSLKLSTSDQSVLSGKTGSGIINGKNTNGWFVGYVETGTNTWFFATNIQGADHADGLTASAITLKVLKAKHILSDL
ncbi:MAG: BlaR1 family beta-lactam sensor/signal transducer [Lachnospiraceae bacterium]|nr:BlaR1 family beta-lactam sensor/signal transducer [Lachnospiraceae bacterium]